MALAEIEADRVHLVGIIILQPVQEKLQGSVGLSLSLSLSLSHNYGSQERERRRPAQGEGATNGQSHLF